MGQVLEGVGNDFSYDVGSVVVPGADPFCHVLDKQWGKLKLLALIKHRLQVDELGSG